MSPEIQLINFNYRIIKNSTFINETTLKYDPGKYGYCFGSTDNKNRTLRIDTQLDGRN
jgi:hypothetical protein